MRSATSSAEASITEGKYGAAWDLNVEINRLVTEH